MISTDISPQVTAAAAEALRGKGPVFMMNLVRYRDQALYPPGSDFTPCSGREAFFQRYVPAVDQVARKIAPGTFKMFFYGQVDAALCGPADENWDNVAIAEYESIEAVRTLVESEDYRTIAEPHRLASLEDWRFIAVTRVVPGA